MATETVYLDLATSRVFPAFQPVTNAEDWIVTLYIFEDGDAYDLDGETATMSVRDSWGSEVLSGTGVASDDDDSVTSILTFTFRASSMADLAPGTYTVAVKIAESPATRQVLLAKLPVRDGGFG